MPAARIIRAFAVSVFLSAAVLAVASNDTGICGGYGPTEQDTDVEGNLLQEVWVLNADFCCNLCDKAAGCGGYSYDAAYQKCYLKSNIVGIYTHPGVVARMKSAPTTCQNYMESDDTDLAGDMLGTREVSEESECCGACDAVTGCEGYAFYENVCYIKTNLQGTFANAGRTARVKNVLPDSCDGYSSAMQDTDIAGEMLQQMWGVSADACCDRCSTTAGCEGYSFGDSTCYLKGKVTGTYVNSGVVARTKTAPPATCTGFSEPQQDTDLAGTIIAQRYANAEEVCCGMCGRTSGCEGYSFSAQWSLCYLKGDTEGTYNNPGVVTRMQTGPGSCTGYSQEYQDTDLAGDMVGTEDATSSDGCCDLCDGLVDCLGFAFFEDVCYMKKNLQGEYENSGRITRFKTSLSLPAKSPAVEISV